MQFYFVFYSMPTNVSSISSCCENRFSNLACVWWVICIEFVLTVRQNAIAPIIAGDQISIEVIPVVRRRCRIQARRMSTSRWRCRWQTRWRHGWGGKWGGNGRWIIIEDVVSFGRAARVWGRTTLIRAMGEGWRDECGATCNGFALVCHAWFAWVHILRTAVHGVSITGQLLFVSTEQRFPHIPFRGKGDG